jgi:hypothetical protein
MKQRLLMLLWVLGALLPTVGCRNLFPSSQSIVISRWNNYAGVESAFQKITPHQSTVKDLQALGFDPKASPNIKILTYVDIIQTFMPNPGIQKEDLPVAVRECIEAKEKSSAYLVELQDIRGKRHGNLLLDIFGFKRMTHESGWKFKGLILINTDLVVYKLSSSEPQIAREEDLVRPLGPLQELDGGMLRVVNVVK